MSVSKLFMAITVATDSSVANTSKSEHWRRLVISSLVTNKSILKTDANNLHGFRHSSDANHNLNTRPLFNSRRLQNRYEANAAEKCKQILSFKCDESTRSQLF